MTGSGTQRRTVDVAALIDQSPLSRLQLRVIALCGLVALLEGYDIQAMAYVAPVVGREFGIDAAALGSVFGAFLFGIAIGNMFISPLADRWGRRSILIGSTLAFGIGALATMWCDSVTELMVVRFLTGVAMGGAASIVALTSEYTPHRLRSTAGMAMLAGLPLGSVLGGLLSAWLIPQFGWRSVFLVGGVVPVVTALLLLVLLPESIRFLVARYGGGERVHRIVRQFGPDVPIEADTRYVLVEEKRTKSSLVALFTDGRAVTTLLVWGAMLTVQLVMYFLLSWIPSLLTDSGLPLSTAILAGTLFSVGGIAGSLILGRLMDRTGRPAFVLCVAIAVAIAAIVTIPMLLPAVGPTFAVIFVLGVGTIGTQIGVINLSGLVYPTLIRSTGVGWAFGIGRVGSILGPVLGGLLIAAGWHTQALFTAVAVPAAVGLAALLVLGLRRPHHSESTTETQSEHPNKH